MLKKLRYYWVSVAMSLVSNTHDQLLAFTDKSAEYEERAYRRASDRYGKAISKTVEQARVIRERTLRKIDKGIEAAQKQARIEEAALHAEMQAMQREYDRLASRIGETQGYIKAVLQHNAETVMDLTALKRKV
ncbi:hypothetical protein CPT_Palo_011 [Rhizobium phage Palo]|uniref:Uncharacterized protein n=1 Tax=Rhizobium phage Palo TaxID=2767573 RepID=A0A7L8G6G8_9CAUD|nr:hypothetical protein CPT_Palo_011 [Rhizobium phage Palo]